jgi:phytoene synthase
LATSGTSFEVCEELVRRGDKDRYLTTLFAPADRRPALQALYAFNIEVARVRDLVSDPLPGEMRLQWWRDALAGCGHGEVGRHPVAAALIETIDRYDLPLDPFLELVEARTFDLYDDPMPTLADLECYCRATASALMRLGIRVLGAGDCLPATSMAQQGGVAYALTGLMRALPFHAARGQVFLPDDLLVRHGADTSTLLAGRETPQLLAALAELRKVAWAHLCDAGDCIPDIRRDAMAALLPIALVKPYLERMDRPEYRPFASSCVVPQWRRQVVLWRAARHAQRCGAARAQLNDAKG